VGYPVFFKLDQKIKDWTEDKQLESYEAHNLLLEGGYVHYPHRYNYMPVFKYGVSYQRHYRSDYQENYYSCYLHFLYTTDYTDNYYYKYLVENNSDVSDWKKKGWRFGFSLLFDDGWFGGFAIGKMPGNSFQTDNTHWGWIVEISLTRFVWGGKTKH